MRPQSPLLAVALLASIGVLAHRPAPAQELTVYAGGRTSSDTRERSYAWKLEYLQGLGEHFHFTWSWLNEGHVLGHHRDGHTLQFWARANVLERRLSLALGGGGYRFYDTQEAPTTQGYADVHGSGAILSGTAAWYFRDRLVVRGEINRIWAPTTTSIDTWTLLVGVGYQLQAPSEPGPRPVPERQREWTTPNEITAFVGRTVVNSFGSESGIASQIAYRRGISRYFVWSVSLINEGDPDVIRRNGIATQMWAARVFLHERFEIGLGVGGYYSLDKKYEPPPGASAKTLSALVTPTFGWRFAPRWILRFDWDRTVTGYDRDTDIFGLGVGYRF